MAHELSFTNGQADFFELGESITAWHGEAEIVHGFDFSLVVALGNVRKFDHGPLLVVEFSFALALGNSYTISGLKILRSLERICSLVGIFLS